VAFKEDDEIKIETVDLKHPVAVIPNTALHLNRKINKGFEYNRQTHLQAILQGSDHKGNPLIEILVSEIKVAPEMIQGMELYFYDSEPAELCGLDQKLVMSGKLDNLSMTHLILNAILETEHPDKTCVAVFFDNEEIGSETRHTGKTTERIRYKTEAKDNKSCWMSL